MRKHMTWSSMPLAGALLMACVGAHAMELRIGRTPTLSQLPLYVLEAEKLVEKHTRAAGVDDVMPKYIDVAGGAVLNDMLIGGNLEIATGGLPPFLILWSRTAGTTAEVKAIAAIGGTPSTLYTRNPKVKSIKDLGPEDRIAVAGVKSSQVAIVLQMAAADAFGDKDYAKLDPLTVTMRDADAVATLKSGKSELSGHFTYDPYRETYAQDPAIHPILQSRDVLGGVGTVALAYATRRFHDANPKIVAAYLAALMEADDIIRKEPERAARDFKALTKAPQSDAELAAMIRQPDAQYTVTPAAVMKFATFMARIGTLKQAPAGWKDVFFPEAHALGGS
ncbi:MAG TPA: ABC transporter substrate-binding protein [Casimicrobiaceae bacterium]|nr:ABC transporter substrate-binding protein [Casimicrobiaceae bacterium]